MKVTHFSVILVWLLAAFFIAAPAFVFSLQESPEYDEIRHLLAKGDAAAAAEAWQQMEPLAGKEYLHWYNLGVLLYDLERYPQAVEAFRSALQDYDDLSLAAKDHSEAVFNLGTALLQAGEYVQAVAVFSAMALTVSREDVFLNRGNAYYMLGDNEQALADYSAAIGYAAGNADAWYNIGNIHYDAERWQESAEAYQTALELQPDYLEVKFNLGNVMMQLQQYAEAQQWYQAVLRDDHMHSDAMESLKIAESMQEKKQGQQ